MRRGPSSPWAHQQFPRGRGTIAFRPRPGNTCTRLEIKEGRERFRRERVKRMKRLPANHRNSTIYRERDLQALRHMAVLLVCGLMAAGGFIFAAGQHFAAVQYGYRVEDLRRESARLLEEQRRLRVEREEIAAPARLEGAARGLGLRPAQAVQVEAGAEAEGSPTHTVPTFIHPAGGIRR